MFYRLFFALSLAVTFLFPRLGAQGLPGHVYQIEEEGSPKELEQDARFKLIQGYLRSGWSESSLSAARKSPNTLFASNFYLPRCRASIIPQAFMCQPSHAARFANLVIYDGYVEAPETGWFRFVGSGDDILMVNFDKKTVLESGYYLPSRRKVLNGRQASYKQKIARAPHATALMVVPGASYYNVDLGGLTAGLPFEVEKGKVYAIKILYVDMGGGAGMTLLLEHLKEKHSASKGRVELPAGQKLDLFRVSDRLPQESETRLMMGRYLEGSMEWIPFHENSLIWKPVAKPEVVSGDDASASGGDEDAPKPKKKKRRKRGNTFRPL